MAEGRERGVGTGSAPERRGLSPPAALSLRKAPALGSDVAVGDEEGEGQGSDKGAVTALVHPAVSGRRGDVLCDGIVAPPFRVRGVSARLADHPWQAWPER
jgi:hypothetical protein